MSVRTVPAVKRVEPPAVQAAEQRAERIRTGLDSVWQLAKDLTDAFKENDWKTLDYDSWEQYCFNEFGAARLKLPSFGTGEGRRHLPRGRHERPRHRRSDRVEHQHDRQGCFSCRESRQLGSSRFDRPKANHRDGWKVVCVPPASRTGPC
jgi:hypothetical protein